jgi:hypothetical protein
LDLGDSVFRVHVEIASVVAQQRRVHPVGLYSCSRARARVLFNACEVTMMVKGRRRVAIRVVGNAEAGLWQEQNEVGGKG